MLRMPEPAWKEARPDPLLDAATEAAHAHVFGGYSADGEGLCACGARVGLGGWTAHRVAFALAAVRPLIEAQTVPLSDDGRALVSDALTALWHQAPRRRDEIRELLLSLPAERLWLDIEGPNDDD